MNEIKLNTMDAVLLLRALESRLANGESILFARRLTDNVAAAPPPVRDVVAAAHVGLVVLFDSDVAANFAALAERGETSIPPTEPFVCTLETEQREEPEAPAPN